MATTFNWIYLGTGPAIDPREGNTRAEDANTLVGQTYGSANNPLYSRITSATMVDNNNNGRLDQDNNTSNDQFVTDIGNGPQTFTFDATAVYRATLTYADGTTATVTAVIAQDTAGNLFLAPESRSGNFDSPDLAAYEAKPIVSITLNSLFGDNYSGMSTDREVTGFDDGFVEGTSGDDLIDSAYVEPVTNGTDKIDNGDGVSSSATGWNDDRVRAGAGNDTVLAGAGNDWVDGGDGNDSILGGDGNDTLLGGNGNDTIDGGTGNDSIVGGAGNDSLLGGAGNDSIIGGDGNDTINGGAGADTIDAGNGDDLIAGGTGNDSILAGSGNDTIIGDAGADTISGGTGMDFVDHSASDAGVNINLSTGSASGGTATGDVYSGIDGIVGSAFDDTLIGFDGFSTNPADPYTNVLIGGAGNDYIDGRGGDDSLYGGDGNDTVLGGSGNDLISGDAGDDSLLGGDGADTIQGGSGNDTIDGGAGNDILSGGLGSDRFVGLGAGDSVDGSEDPDNSDNDVLDLFGSGWTKATTNIIFSDPTKENGTVEFLDSNGNVIGTLSFSNIETVVPCFTPGTLIATGHGDIPVEELRVGDRVLTLDHGYQPIRWIGRKTLTDAELDRAPNLRPVLIRRGALGSSRPERDMRLSPQHRVLIAAPEAELMTGEPQLLAPAIQLVGQPGIAQEVAAKGVTYIHLLFDRHEIILSDGIWSESFQPGEATLNGMEDAQRAELCALFPELETLTAAPYPAARPTTRRHELRAILATIRTGGTHAAFPGLELCPGGAGDHGIPGARSRDRRSSAKPRRAA